MELRFDGRVVVVTGAGGGRTSILTLSSRIEGLDEPMLCCLRLEALLS